MSSGVVQIDWKEVNAYQQATSTSLTPFEANTVYMLSAKYAAMFNSSNLKPMPPPYFNVDNIQIRLDESLTGFSKRAKSAL